VIGQPWDEPADVPSTSTSETQRLLLVDPHRGLRDALAGRLSRGRYDVVSTVDSGEYGLEAAYHLKPDIVMLEVRLPGASGIVIATQMSALEVKPRVLFYTGESDPAVLHAALVAGAVGYALKASTLDEVRWAVEQVANGRTYIDPRLEGSLRAPGVAACGPLTERESDVLTLAAQGLTTGDIAEQLGLGLETVRTYVDRAVRKLRARNRTHAATIALEAGLIRLTLPPGIEARVAARAAVAAAGDDDVAVGGRRAA